MVATNLYGNHRNAVHTRYSGVLSFQRHPLQSAAGSVMVVALTIALNLPAFLRAETLPPNTAPPLNADYLFALEMLSRKHFEELPDAALLGAREITAFEENPRFVYLAARTDRWLRRVVLLKPGTLVVEDRLQAADEEIPVSWALFAAQAFKSDGWKFSNTYPYGELHGETLLPKDTITRFVGSGGDNNAPAKHHVKINTKADRPETCFLHVFQIHRPGDELSRSRSELVQEDDGWRLTVAAGDQTLKLLLPNEPNAAGTIAIAGADGESLLNERLLPSGIMPYGAEGVALLKRWDTPYHANRRPGWDTGRVAPELKRPELKKVLQKAAEGRGRAVVFGCGTGTNAIYLASRGFEVTGIDVAPTALTRAARKAHEAGVNVRWVLADVSALPEFKPFDFVFDRGCYHHVRQYDAAGYVNSVHRLSHPGTRLLILAGSANEERRAGPPKIKEEEIRNDFSARFEFEWLREIRFDSVNPDSKGPLAWSVLLRRKEGKP